MRFLYIIFGLLAIIFPFGQLFRFRIPLFPVTVKFQLIDILVFVFLIVWLLLKKKKTSFPLFFKEIIYFGIAASLSFFIKFFQYSIVEIIPAFFYLLRFWNYILFYFAFFNFLKLKKIKIKDILIAEGFAVAGISLSQYLFIPDVRFLSFFGWDDHYFRAIGSFLDPGFTGLILVLSLIVLLTVFSDNKKVGIKYYVLCVLILLAIALSFSRISYITAFMSLFLVLCASGNKKNLFVLSLFLLSAIVFSPKPGGEGVDLLRRTSAVRKIENYQYVFKIIKDNFFFGVGYNFYRSAQKSYGFIMFNDWDISNSGAGADNSFLFVLATTGIVGLAFFLNLWRRILVESYKKIKMNEGSLIVFTSSLVLIVQSFFINGIFYSWSLFWLVLILSEFSVDSES